MKKIFLFILILMLGVLAFLYKEQSILVFSSLEEFTGDNILLISLVLILLMIFASSITFPALTLTILCGALLGSFWGSIVSIIGHTLGAGVAFLISRYIFGDLVQRKLITKYPSISSIQNRLVANGVKTVASLRLVLFFPYNVLNYILGTTSISFSKYMLGTFIGIIPAVLIFSYLGDLIRKMDFINIGVTIVLMIFLSLIISKHQKKVIS